MFQPRPLQKEILKYTSGMMGIAAVPGAGKTATLSYLAADLIAKSGLAEDQEILIVTLVNSAVDNFSSRIFEFLKTDKKLIPNIGYRVRTLHGLAHDIVRERPDLVGLSDRFSIIEEREAAGIIKSLVASWIRSNLDTVNQFTKSELDYSTNKKVRDQWQDLGVSLATSFIKQAKDLQVTPGQIADLLGRNQIDVPMLSMGNFIYKEYQQTLAFRSSVDFDDLIRLALKALSVDPEFLARLQHRWPYILEDEAQDSSRLQEQILNLLSGDGGNWVRVGDTNQAIYETFTTANPEYLRRFIKREDVISRNLSNSGRSTFSIISLANHMIHWTQENHPVLDLRKSLNPPFIEPSPAGDPQPNPVDNLEGITLFSTEMTPENEISSVVRSLEKWLPENPERTVAVLVPRNERGTELVGKLQEKNINYMELLRSTSSTRLTAETLTFILKALEDPLNPQKCSSAFTNLFLRKQIKSQDKVLIKKAAGEINRCSHLEDYLSPILGKDWIEKFKDERSDSELYRLLLEYRSILQRWHRAVLLPIDQLILTISQEIFADPSDLALSYKLALLLEQTSLTHPEWTLKDFANELETIANNERKFLGFSNEDTGFDPDQHKGKVIVATIHKAKGLEWDRVYLLSANNYDFPSALPGETFIGEKWFLNGEINLEAETLAKLKHLVENNIPALSFEEGVATAEARLSYCAERLRLFYVGITRARRELIITWNTGRQGNCKPSIPYQELMTFWNNQHASAI